MGVSLVGFIGFLRRLQKGLLGLVFQGGMLGQGLLDLPDTLDQNLRLGLLGTVGIFLRNLGDLFQVVGVGLR